jgi:hypothetical protein
MTLLPLPRRLAAGYTYQRCRAAGGIIMNILKHGSEARVWRRYWFSQEAP